LASPAFVSALFLKPLLKKGAGDAFRSNYGRAHLAYEGGHHATMFEPKLADIFLKHLDGFVKIYDAHNEHQGEIEKKNFLGRIDIQLGGRFLRNF